MLNSLWLTAAALLLESYISQALKSLLTLLNLGKIEEGPFRSQSEDLGSRQMFGGQVVDQAPYAAERTVSEERLVHSFHSYFLHPGDGKKPIIYNVETLRDGSSLSVRRAATIQNGKPIFYMTAPFQAPRASFEYQKTMSSVPAPDGLSSETQIAQSLAHLLPSVLKDKFICDRPLEACPVEFRNPLRGYVVESHRRVRIHANGNVPDDLRVHQYLLSYASDLNFLPAALQPHDIGPPEPRIQIATADHSMWSHHPFNLSRWLLHSMESISASGARGLVRGESYIQDGVLITSTVQEGVARSHN